MTAPGHPQDDRLLELAYGEVEGAEARALRRHVDDCPRCRSVLDGIAEVRSAVRRVPPEPAPERGLESLLAYGELAAAQARAHRRNVRWLGLLTLATAAALVFVLLPQRQAPATVSGEVARAEPRASEVKLPAPSDRPLRSPGATPAQGDSLGGATRVVAEEKVAAKPKAKDAERKTDGKRDEDLGKQLAVAKEQAPPPELVRHEPLSGADTARRADAVADARAPAAADDALQSGLRQEAKKEVAGQAQATSAGLARAKAAAPPAKVAAATPAPASSAPATAAATGPAQLEKSRPSNEVEGSGAVGLLGSSAGADKGLGTVGAAGSGAKGAAGRTANVTAENAAGKAGDDRAARLTRLAEVRRAVVDATGDQRKALLLEQCRLEASLELRAPAVGTCSQVAREFPGTKEAQQAVDLARGFSVQPPPSPAP